MAAIDPSAVPEHTGTANGNVPARATLKLIYDPTGPGRDEDSETESEHEENYLKALLAGGGPDDEDDEEDDESSSDDEEANGGPSDPSKTKKARREAAMQQMMAALAEGNDDSEDDVDMDSSPKANGLIKAKSTKGKGKALAEGSEESESEDDSEVSLDGLDEQVVCTLDPEKVRNPIHLFYDILKLRLHGLLRITNNPSISRSLKISAHTSRSQALMQSTLLVTT